MTPTETKLRENFEIKLCNLYAKKYGFNPDLSRDEDGIEGYVSKCIEVAYQLYLVYSTEQEQDTAGQVAETGWLIEMLGATPLWLRVDGTLTRVASDAFRFGRKQDAEGFLEIFLAAKFGNDALSIYKRRLSKEMYVSTEHIWHGDQSAPIPAQAVPVSDAQIKEGWRDTFSTDNPFCPCDLKSFTKAVRWHERITAQSPTEGKS